MFLELRISFIFQDLPIFIWQPWYKYTKWSKTISLIKQYNLTQPVADKIAENRLFNKLMKFISN